MSKPLEQDKFSIHSDKTNDELKKSLLDMKRSSEIYSDHIKNDNDTLAVSRYEMVNSDVKRFYEDGLKEYGYRNKMTEDELSKKKESIIEEIQNEQELKNSNKGEYNIVDYTNKNIDSFEERKEIRDNLNSSKENINTSDVNAPKGVEPLEYSKQFKEEIKREESNQDPKYPHARQQYRELVEESNKRMAIEAEQEGGRLKSEVVIKHEALAIANEIDRDNNPDRHIKPLTEEERSKAVSIDDKTNRFKDLAVSKEVAAKLKIGEYEAENAVARKNIETHLEESKKQQPQAQADNVEALEVGNTKLGVPEKVNNRYLIEKGALSTKYNFKDNPEELAFRDKGNKIVTGSDSKAVAESIVEVANAKGWEQLKVNGNQEFKREVWIQANLKGIEVKGYKPTEQDKELLEKRTQSVEAAPRDKVSDKVKEETKPDSKVTAENNQAETEGKRMADAVKKLATVEIAKELKAVYENEKADPEVKKDPRVSEMYKFEKAAVQVANVKFNKDATTEIKTEQGIETRPAREEFVSRVKDKAFTQLAEGKSLNVEQNLKYKQPEKQVTQELGR